MFRSRIRKVALFVDAICIDQKNDVEKDEQIKLMGHVYHCAKRVLIWLGPGSPRTDLAFKEIRFLYRFRCFLETRDHRPITSNRIERLRTWVWQRTEAHDLRLTRESLKFHSHYWAACLDCPYFERVWPLQETAVASRPLLICGDARMSFNAAKFAFIFMTPFLPEMLRQFPALNRFNGYEVHLALAKVFRLEKYEIWKRPEDVHQLRAVLLFVRRLNATVVSDKLFSLFTILRAFCPDFPEPQKGIRTTELWPAATVAILKAVRCLDLIVGVFPKAEDVLPSWSFDWTTDPTYYKDWDAPADVLKRATPSGTVWDNAPRLGRASQPGDKKALRTKGVRYSKVVARSPDLGVFRDWYGDAKNDDAEETNRSRFRENRPEFASASEHVARMLFEWDDPSLYTLVSFAYIQGLVDCQTWNMKEEALEEFTLV
ncbi:hypothetical protein EG327_009663 [Venturia inaequalis]|uniref:Heterokaryon incompatibility domain-containing protein n=1 Tax=Venturia inaequalis TaxID=5025 RepID=A0A8H3UM83_VENIN|nr:hypothetical protein EG327_009663 [Venturia inaequalis]